MLKGISKTTLVANASLVQYFDVLLFLAAYANNEDDLTLCEKELSRATAALKKSKTLPEKVFNNTGLPFTKTVTGFSYDFLRWLLTHPHVKTELTRFENPAFDLNDVLKLTLPSLERYETTAGNNNIELLDELLIKKDDRLSFILTEISKIEHQPYLKDHLFEGLDAYVTLTPKDASFSKAYNRLSPRNVFFHEEIMKRFDHEALLNRELPPAVALTKVQRIEAIEVVKNSMAITGRETDTSTYMDENSFCLFELERGISIAIYGMIPERQLPLESYVGFTLFKNGFPASYGGAWVFGERSNFGINIFESFRGGESGYMMCQLLRVYKQVFGITYFEVEPYQYGLDNPEGIESGAFWFYYRYGFRPIDKKLRAIADKEYKKIASKKGYRTSKKILEHFTESNIELKMGRKTPKGVYDITPKIKKMLQKQYDGNRLRAEKDCVMRFKIKTRWSKPIDRHEAQVMKEVALWAEALQINDAKRLGLLAQMVKVKPVDLLRTRRYY
ncbi:MAG: hypothetical protein IPP51_17385 [Bacteroidetes bacterium]|nr:hypothetical protein [Bacteroidota bacterium]